MQHDEVFKGCDVTYVPIFLGGLMHKVSPELNLRESMLSSWAKPSALQCGNTAPIKIKSTSSIRPSQQHSN